MITPMDLQNKKFRASAFGYKKSEVDDFIEELLKDYEEIYLKSFETNKKLDNLTKQIESYKSMEETMKKTLVVAETAAEQVREAARKEADAIVSEANLSAKEIISKATSKLDSLREEFERVKDEMKRYIIQSKAQIQIQLASLESNEEKSDKATL